MPKVLLERISYLEEALDQAAKAKKCIKQNKGYDKHLAAEGYESAVYEMVGPALVDAVEALVEEAYYDDIYKISSKMLVLLKKAEEHNDS